MKEPRLENWLIRESFIRGPYDPPEFVVAVASGNVYGHPHFADGDTITTSKIMKSDPTAGWIETLNTTYKLGKIDSGFKSYLASNNYTLDNYKKGVSNG